MFTSLTAVYASRLQFSILQNAAKTCIPCRSLRFRRPMQPSQIPNIPEERRKTSQFDDLDFSQIQPQYRHVKELENAPESVRKVFSLEFATEKEKLEAKFLSYAKQLQSNEHDFNTPEVEIARFTVFIRSCQERHVNTNYRDKKLRKLLPWAFEKRNRMIGDLRQTNYESYCNVLKVLDLNYFHQPEYNVHMTRLAERTADMRLRTFAEIERVKNEKIRRSKEIDDLQADILEKIKSGELVPQENTELHSV